MQPPRPGASRQEAGASSKGTSQQHQLQGVAGVNQRLLEKREGANEAKGGERG